MRQRSESYECLGFRAVITEIVSLLLGGYSHPRFVMKLLLPADLYGKMPELSRPATTQPTALKLCVTDLRTADGPVCPALSATNTRPPYRRKRPNGRKTS